MFNEVPRIHKANKLKRAARYKTKSLIQYMQTIGKKC